MKIQVKETKRRNKVKIHLDIMLFVLRVKIILKSCLVRMK